MQQKSHLSKNLIISRLSAAEMALLKSDLERIELPLRYVLEEANEPISHSYFIQNGLASVVAGNGRKRLEVGLIGCEGMSGIPIVLGNDRSPRETFMQVAGNGMRITADKLRGHLTKSITRTGASKFRSCFFKSNFQHRTRQRHCYARGTIGKMACDGERPTGG